MAEQTRGPVGNLWRDTLVLFLAVTDARVPLYVKGGVLLGIAYLLSPVDLLPEFVPLAGFIDDLIIVPLVMRTSFGLILRDVVEDLRRKADSTYGLGKRIVLYTVLIVALWIIAIVAGSAYLITRLF